MKFHVHKDRPAFLTRPHAAELSLDSDTDTHATTWTWRPASAEGNGWQPTVLMEKVSRYLEQQGEAVSRNAVEKARLGAAEYVRQAMDALVADQYVLETAGPRNARLLSSIKPFRTSSEFVATSSARRTDGHRVRVPFLSERTDLDPRPEISLPDIGGCR